MPNWYYSKEGQQLGPVDDAALKQLAASGGLSPAEFVWKDGEPDWVEASTVPGLFTARPAASVQPPPQSQQTSAAARSATPEPAGPASPAARAKPNNKRLRVLLLASGGILFLAVTVVIFCFIRMANTEARRTACQSNMGRINAALQEYAKAHNHQYPATLGDLLIDGKLAGPEVLICPGSGDTPAPGPTPREQAGNLIAGHLSYVYRGKGLTDRTAGADIVVLYENPPGHGGNINFLFGDGRVETAKPDRAAQLMVSGRADFNDRLPSGAGSDVKPGLTYGNDAGAPEDAGPWISVAKGIDTRTAGANWKLHSGVLTGQLVKGKSEAATIALPVAPTGDFDFQLTFNRRSGNKEFCVLIPIAGHAAQLTVGGGDGQVTSISGKDFEVGSDVQIVNGKDQRLGVTVRVKDQRVDVSVALNGHPYGNFRDAIAKLTAPAAAPRSGAIGLTIGPDTKVEIKEIRIRTVGGSIRTIK